jgi:hypothetical protein
MELHQRELSDHHRRFMHRATLIVVCLLAAITIGVLLIERRRKQHYLRLQKELQRNQAKIYKMYESIEDQRDNGSLTREQIVTLYRDNLAKSIVLFKQNRWAQHLQLLSEQRSKDIPSFTIKEREQLAEALEHCFINVKTNLRDEAAKHNSKLSAEDIHLCIYMALGYSTGVIRECLAASSDNVVNQRKKRLVNKLPEDILSLFMKNL